MEAYRGYGRDVVYFVEDGRIKFGVADPDDNGYRIIDLLELADYHYVKGVPVSEFQTEEEWHPLPKGWTYNTKLFEMEDRTPEAVLERQKQLRIDRPEDIRTALKEGILVYAYENYHGVIESEIDRHKGWRISKHYPAWTLNYAHRHRTYVILPKADTFGTFQDAAQRLKEQQAAQVQLAKMTDEEWSWREIENVLKHVPELVRDKCMQFLRTVPDIADVEVRKKNGRIEWRRYNNRTAWELIPGVDTI